MTPWLVAALCFLLALLMAALIVAQRSEIRYLRERLAEKAEHRKRIERAEIGLPELQPEKTNPDPIPPGIQTRIDEAIGAWAGSATQDQLRADVRAWRSESPPRDWHWIASQLEQEMA